MPDVLRVRYLGDAPATIPIAGKIVDPDCVFDLPATIAAELEDCVVVSYGNPPQDVALPKTLYKIETPSAKKTKE